MKGIIDRFEGDLAVVEIDGQTKDLPREILPSDAQVGDVLEITITLLKEETKKLKSEIDQLMQDVWED
ncbi:DUF3006 domain-containing protein [Pseudoneobacillus sp. C159]